MSEVVRIKNDEPSEDDRLKRDEYVKTFAKIATTCDTPIVIGLYGRLGGWKDIPYETDQKGDRFQQIGNIDGLV